MREEEKEMEERKMQKRRIKKEKEKRMMRGLVSDSFLCSRIRYIHLHGK